MPTFLYVLPAAEKSPLAQGNSVPKRLRSLSRLSFGFLGLGGAGGEPGPPKPAAGGCIASYSLAGISRSKCHTFVGSKTHLPGGSLAAGGLSSANAAAAATRLNRAKKSQTPQ